MVSFNGKLFSQYPPGFPFLLSLGVKFDVAGLVNPLFSAATVFLIYLIVKQLMGPPLALLTSLMLITNSYFLGYGASYFSQPASLFLTSLGLLFYLNYLNTNKIVNLSISALSISFLTIVRPLDALCLWGALFSYLIIHKRTKIIKHLLVFCLLSGTGLIILFVYNGLILGKWSIFFYPSDILRIFYNANDNTILSYIGNFLKNYYSNIQNYFLPLLSRYFLPFLICWIPLIILNFLSVPKVSYFRDFYQTLLIYSFLLVALHNVHYFPDLGWPQYGARYWYPLFAPMSVWLAQGLKTLYFTVPRRLSKYLTILIATCLIWQSFQTVADLLGYSKRFDLIQKIQVDIKNSCPEKSIVVLRSSCNWSKSGQFISMDTFKRNPFLHGKRIFYKEEDGIVEKHKFSEDDSNGNAILEGLIKQGVLEEVNSSVVRLKRNADGSVTRPPEIAGSNFDEIWFILKHTNVAYDTRKIKEFYKDYIVCDYYLPEKFR